MDTITPEEANEWLRKFPEDDNLPEQSPHAEEDVPWEQKQPLSWSEFLAIMVRYCNARHWQISFDSVDDRAVAIFAHQEQVVTGAEARQERLPFGDEEGGLPF